MRITGGKYVRRNIICPPGIIRPAMDRMRESLFAHLGPLDGESFLDLFSGSGCVAIEAASRGASTIHLVEMDRGKKDTIEKNLSFVEEDKKLFLMDVNRFISMADMRYSMIYADPPFNMEGKTALAENVSAYRLLAVGGLFIVLCRVEEDRFWPEETGTLRLCDRRKYGRSILRFYKEARQ